MVFFSMLMKYIFTWEKSHDNQVWDWENSHFLKTYKGNRSIVTNWKKVNFFILHSNIQIQLVMLKQSILFILLILWVHFTGYKEKYIQI